MWHDSLLFGLPSYLFHSLQKAQGFCFISNSTDKTFYNAACVLWLTITWRTNHASSLKFIYVVKINMIHRTIILPFVLYGCETWSLTLRKERKLRVFENMVLMRIFGHRSEEVTGEWRRLHNEELKALYSSPNTVRVIKSRRMKWAGHLAHMGEERGVYRVLVGKPEGRSLLGRPRHRWVDNIRVDLQEVGCGYMDWIGLAQDRDGWRRLVSVVMNLRVPWNAGNFLTSCKPVSFSRTLHNGVSK